MDIKENLGIPSEWQYLLAGWIESEGYQRFAEEIYYIKHRYGLKNSDYMFWPLEQVDPKDVRVVLLTCHKIHSWTSPYPIVLSSGKIYHTFEVVSERNKDILIEQVKEKIFKTAIPPEFPITYPNYGEYITKPIFCDKIVRDPEIPTLNWYKQGVLVMNISPTGYFDPEQDNISDHTEVWEGFFKALVSNFYRYNPHCVFAGVREETHKYIDLLSSSAHTIKQDWPKDIFNNINDCLKKNLSPKHIIDWIC